MSIWSSLNIDHEPYLDFVDASDHYTLNSPESLASTPRGGFIDVAISNLCDLIRVSVQDEISTDSVEVWLDPTQARALATELLKHVHIAVSEEGTKVPEGG